MKHTLAAVTIAALAVASLAGCTRTVYVKAPPTAAPADVSTPSDTASSPFDYQLETPQVTLRITSKQCFGSAGCNVTVSPTLAMADTSLIPPDATGSITFEIDGGSDGPVIDTITLTGSQYQIQDEVLSTASSSSRLTVKVTGVTTN
jgi:predicted small lipoprotein YifL